MAAMRRNNNPVIMQFFCQNKKQTVTEWGYFLSKEEFIIRLIEGEVSENGFEEQIVIPKQKKGIWKMRQVMSWLPRERDGR